MPPRFHPCPDCGYAVRSGAAHCPDCGLVLQREGGLLGKLLRRKAPTHHPDNLRALEGRVAQELARLEGQLEHLEATAAKLRGRLDAALREGRDGAPLRDALAGLEQAVLEARGLIHRQQALRAGIVVQREHNEIQAFMDGLEEAAAGDGPVRLLQDRPPQRTLPPTGERAALLDLAWSPCGRWLAGVTAVDLMGGGTEQRLLFWDLAVEPAVMRSLALPCAGASCLAFSRDGALLAVGCAGGVELLDCARASWAASGALRKQQGPAAQVSCLAFGPGGSWLVVGTERGELARFGCALVGGEWQLRAGRPVGAVQGFPVRSVAVSPDGTKLFSSGGGSLRLWWVRGDQLMGFSRRDQAGAGLIGLERRGERLAVAEQGYVAVYDDTLSKQLGRFQLSEPARALRPAGCGERVAVLAGARVLLGSPDSRRVLALPCGEEPFEDVAFAVDALRGALAGRDERGELVVRTVDWGAGGLVGFTRKAMVGLEWSALEVLRLRAAYGLDRVGSFAEERNYALHRQLREMLRDAGLAAIYAVTRRAEAAEVVTRGRGDLVFVAEHLRGLFAELEDLHAQVSRVLPLAPDLEPYLAKLAVLPVAVLRGQADALMQAIEATLRGTQGVDEAQQRAALEELEVQQAHARALGQLANGLSGPFWGNPERPLLVESLRKLERDFPGWVDAVMARLASSAIGRIDALEEHFGLDRLRDQRTRIAGQAHGSGEIGVEADLLLESALGHGPLGKDATEAERAGNQDALDDEARRLDAETRAFLETQRVTRTL